jgi:gliding motility-associated lipoprotein GldH
MQKKVNIWWALLILFLVFGCTGKKDIVAYYRFSDQAWKRFDPVRFEITINEPEKYYDVSFFAHHTSNFEFENLDFNMVMTTPSGEERIKEYQMKVRRKDGGFIGKLVADSCELSVSLKKELKLTPGILVIELENLVPRLQTKGLLGIGIRLHPVQ